MFLAPEGDEMEIATAAADFLAEAMPIDRLHSSGSADMSAAMRGHLGEMGWFALAVPEASGGSGLSAVEHALFFREVGRQCGPVDVLAQVLAARLPAPDDVHAALLSGEIGVALAVGDGDRTRVIGGTNAAYALNVTPDRTWFARLADAGETRPALDPATSMRLTDGVLVEPVVKTNGPDVWRFGVLGTAAMLVGIAEAALDLIVEYAKVRETFGRKIGAYQAVRHPCADMALRVEAARCQLWYAAAALKEGRDDVDTHLDAAKHLANQAALANADSNIQLHGGIGVTDEHHAHLMLKHAMLLGKLFGGKRAVLARLLHAKAA
ncbi:acyl-CoA dehydrogenase family protein [uncultured Sphingomonas sp.]|uniref:acyl-CoA dehydrogenase family protein n=1 Tax=uncultured Sphingomonas sp. TaxID=158754 RepID=UPI0026044ABC|nr:acyl-CoA dehydrogenase family protein [uncultured Sphingomonas sp.]